MVAKPGPDAYRMTGKFSSMGESEVGSKADFVGEFWNLFRLSSSSGGGVGVRGGRGIGLSAIDEIRFSCSLLHRHMILQRVLPQCLNMSHARMKA